MPMIDLEFFSIISIGGTLSFAASGTLAGIRKELDLFGISVMAFVTAIGGGTIRDILLGQPVKWLTDYNGMFWITGALLLTLLFRKHIGKADQTLILFDTLGLGFFTCRGLEVGLQQGLGPLSALILGVITACFGGVIRDILLNEIPVLFRKEIYATACLAGGLLYLGLHHLECPVLWINSATIALIFVIRTIAIKKNISLRPFH